MSWTYRLAEWRARRQAARWLARHLGGPAPDHARFDAWRRAHPANAAAYARLASLLPSVAGVRRAPPVAAAWPAPRLAASASLAALLLAAVAGLPFPPQVHATTIGEQREIVLSDGSRLRLDTDTRVRVYVGWWQRDVEVLRGRARIAVAAASRPFEIEAGRANASTMQAVLDVRHDRTRTELTVLAGRARVAAGGVARPVAAGKAVRLEGNRLASGPADLPAARGWPAGRLVFTDRSLAEVVAEASRYSVRPLRVSGDAAARRVTASFATGEAAGTARMLATSLGLELRREGNALVLHAPGETAEGVRSSRVER